MNRRHLLRTLGLAGAACATTPALGRFGLGLMNRVKAQSRKRVVIIRTLFDLRDRGRTNLANDLGPLSQWGDRVMIATGLGISGDGSEYHNGKQVRFATSCRPVGRPSHTNGGGGAFDGASVDVVAGEHLRGQQGSRTGSLILGAYPYSDTGLHTTFETISFASRLQYVRPEYNLAAVSGAIASFASFCSDTHVAVDVEGLRRENRAIEAVMLDLSRSRRGAGEQIAGQVEALEAQFAALREDNERTIASDVPCSTFRTRPLGHSYTRHHSVPEAFDGRLRQMNHVAALALRTNYTSVVTLNYNFSGHGQPGIPGYHDYTHPGGFSRAPSAAELAALDGLSHFQVEMFAHLLRELQDFGILNDTLVVYSPHERPTHDHRDVPVIAVNSGSTGQRAIARSVPDVNRDILEWVGVPAAGNFGGETSRGGVIRGV
ncbi:MAG: DUF1552 domain-containing protein [Myxococcales bacterium]|nr:DUF1552 domain-containing protein [Myxococcales bacterium]